ncbi:uncharacterized protein Triagg1_10668 [Trichoderma aggressivum f. europaeum]|uniref:Uncharacterized protein n=1 Tax=Trichoderma aggressivum f. europaeum TaxID=173218 RepID=A0AAE1LUY9_9HYPO|nr:hypothetical protein Triagg1_10668 [Trichoderma aggressivum f. europaeum]
MSSRKWWENPIVTINVPPDSDPEQVRLKNETYIKPKGGYGGASASYFEGISKEEQEMRYQLLVTRVFHLIDVDPAEHQACFRKCVDKCVSTGVLQAQNWLQWGGYNDLSFEMHTIARATQLTGQVHILDAPSVVAAIAFITRRNAEGMGNDYLISLLINLNTFHYAHTSVEHWREEADSGAIIRTTERYRGLILDGGVVINLDAEPVSSAGVGKTVTTINTTPVSVDHTVRNIAQFKLNMLQFDIPHSRPRTTNSRLATVINAMMNVNRYVLENLYKRNLSHAVEHRIRTASYESFGYSRRPSNRYADMEAISQDTGIEHIEELINDDELYV